MDELPEFDAPVFKKLAKNDSGNSGANQAGFLIPKELHPYFPPLVKTDDEVAPGVPIKAILMLGNEYLEQVETRYQLQTWGGKRKGEHRITGNLTPLRGESSRDDILVIERNIADRSLYRLTLLKPKSEAYKAINARPDGKRWGATNPLNPPALDADFERAEQRQIEHQAKELELFDNGAVVSETKAKKVARSRAFEKLVSHYYQGKCALCGKGLVAESGKSEAEAAHIVPRGRFGADDARNGLALCRAHHWAFDKGMWGIDGEEKVVVHPAVADLPENVGLKDMVGERLAMPSNPLMKPDVRALAWHMDNIFNKPAA